MHATDEFTNPKDRKIIALFRIPLVEDYTFQKIREYNKILCRSVYTR